MLKLPGDAPGGAGRQVRSTRSTMAAGGPARSRSTNASSRRALADGEATHRPIGLVGDPAGQSECHGLAMDEVRGTRRPGPGRGRPPRAPRPSGGAALRPGEHQRVEDELGRHVAGDEFRAALERSPGTEPGCPATGPPPPASTPRGGPGPGGTSCRPPPTRARSRATSIQTAISASAARRRRAAGIARVAPSSVTASSPSSVAGSDAVTAAALAVVALPRRPAAGRVAAPRTPPTSRPRRRAHR